MDKTTSQKLRLGIFVIVGTLLLIVAVYFIGNRQNIFGGTFRISAVFRNVNGLQPGNNVRFSGINVGTVKDIEMINDTTIRVSLMIEEKMQAHIRKNAIASVGTDGLVGSMIINITPGGTVADMVEPGDELQTYSRIATDDMLGTLNVTNENAALLTLDLLKITQSIIKGNGTLARLLNDTLMAKDLYQTIANLEHISSELNLAMIEIGELIENVNYEGSAADALLSDSVSGRKIRNLIIDLEAAGSEFKQAVGTINTAVDQIKDGEGALNYLTTDTSFVFRLDTTMQNLQQGSSRFNESMEALKHNFLLRNYFKKQEKKKAKLEE